MYPIFKCSILEHVKKVNLNTTKVYLVEFFSKPDSQTDWVKEYSKQITKHELEVFSPSKIIQSLKDSYYTFQEKHFCNYTMFIVDGIMYGGINLDYEAKEIHGSLINNDLYMYLGPTKVAGDVSSFDLMELLAAGEQRLMFFETDDAVIVGKFVYMNGEIALELNDKQFESVLESPYDFCESHKKLVNSLKAKAVYHEHDLLCEFDLKGKK
jgi:hypothetical protein